MRTKPSKSVYLIGQDYSFGHAVLREAKAVGRAAPDVAVVGDELHPVGRVKGLCALYAVKIKEQRRAGGGHRQLGQRPDPAGQGRPRRGLRGQLLHLLWQRAGRARRHGDAGIGKVVAVADWLPNVPGAQSEAFYQSFRTLSQAAGRLCAHAHAAHDRGPGPVDRAAGTTDVVAVARQMDRPACSWRGRAAPCALPTTSFSKRWRWA